MIENREVQKGAIISVHGIAYQVEEVHVRIENFILSVTVKAIGMDLATYWMNVDSNTKLGNVGRTMEEYVKAGNDYAEAYRKSQPDGIVHPGTLYSLAYTHTVYLINTECFS